LRELIAIGASAFDKSQLRRKYMAFWFVFVAAAALVSAGLFGLFVGVVYKHPRVENCSAVALLTGLTLAGVASAFLPASWWWIKVLGILAAVTISLVTALVLAVPLVERRLPKPMQEKFFYGLFLSVVIVQECLPGTAQEKLWGLFLSSELRMNWFLKQGFAVAQDEQASRGGEGEGEEPPKH
jgi:hypothetical protein